MIRQVNEEMVEAVTAFVIESRRKIFPMLDDTMMPHDIKNFPSVYLSQHNAAFFASFDEQQRISGVIGIIPYDNRFPQFNYHPLTTCEVVKLYVSPSYRRTGLATKLVEQVKFFAKKQHMDMLYLHTHPFLTGARELWQNNGFTITLEEDIPVWNTIHMEHKLSQRNIRNANIRRYLPVQFTSFSTVG